MTKRFFSLAALTVLELPPDEMIDVAASTGYGGVGLRLIPATPEEVHFSLLDSPKLRRATFNRLRNTDIRVVDIEILRLTPQTRVIEDFSRVLELGANLGASEVLVAGNDNHKSRILDNFCSLCELAQPFDLHPHLEFMPWTGVSNLSEARHIIGKAHETGHANAGLLVDAFHFNRSDSHLAELAQIPNSWMRYVQLCDVAGKPPTEIGAIMQEARTERRFPGEGDIDLEGLLRAVPADVPLSLEIPTQKLYERGIDATKRAAKALSSARDVVSRIEN